MYCGRQVPQPKKKKYGQICLRQPQSIGEQKICFSTPAPGTGMGTRHHHRKYNSSNFLAPAIWGFTLVFVLKSPLKISFTISFL